MSRKQNKKNKQYSYTWIMLHFSIVITTLSSLYDIQLNLKLYRKTIYLIYFACHVIPYTHSYPIL